MTEDCCLNCKYSSSEFLDDPESDVVECTRYPPQVTEWDDNDHGRAQATKFPVISYVRLCGEYVREKE
jgi:hypothetical protein